MSTAALIRAMAAAGASPEAIALAVEAVEAASSRSRPDDGRVWVYVMAHDHPGSDLVKVGISQHPNYRREVLEREEQINLYLAHTEGPFARATAFSIEQRAHERLQAFRERGEWFLCGADRAAEVVRAISAGGAK